MVAFVSHLIHPSVAFRHTTWLVSVVASLLWLTGAAWAQPYTFTTIDMPFPDACCTQIHGTNRDQIKVGAYMGQSGELMGFRGMALKYTMFPLLEIMDINDNGVMVGHYRTTLLYQGEQIPSMSGFVHTGSLFAQVHVPGMRECSAKKISLHGTIVGDCADETGNHAFLQFADGTYQVLDVPFESWDGFGLTGINDQGPDGDLVGGYSGRGFARIQGEFTRVDVPGAHTTIPKAIRGRTIVGISCAGLPERCHGFTTRVRLVGFEEVCCDDTAYQQIMVPGSTFTSVEDITTSGGLVGLWFSDQSTTHGFVATPR